MITWGQKAELVGLISVAFLVGFAYGLYYHGKPLTSREELIVSICFTLTLFAISVISAMTIMINLHLNPEEKDEKEDPLLPKV